MLSPPVDEGVEFMTAGAARAALNYEYRIDGPDDLIPNHIIYVGPDTREEGIG